MFGKVLILLPNTNDRAEASKIDPVKYETHFLHSSDEEKDKKMSTFDYSDFLVKPGFLNNYVDRAVKYVRENGINGVMYGHDMSSVVASVVCKKTGLPGPSLDSTFICLHKYYSRQNSPGNLWYDYIDLDDSDESWKIKVRYPCFLKPPMLTSAKGCCAVENETAMIAALANIRELTLPYFKGYAQFFHKYLDLKKFPLAVKNIVVVEELIQCKDQYSVESWIDENSVCSTFTTHVECFCNQKEDILTGYVNPVYTLDKNDVEIMVKTAENAARRTGLLNTFFDVELWKIGNKFKIVEINARCTSMSSAMYKRMFGFSNYEAAIALACGQRDNIPKSTPVLYQQGDEISGNFYMLSYEEGSAKNLIDFEYARNEAGQDGAYSNHGPGIELFVTEESVVKQTSTRGVTLCICMLTANSVDELFDKMKKIRSKVFLCQDHPDLHIVEPKRLENRKKR